MNKDHITYLYNNGIISSFDANFARFIARVCKHDDPYVQLAAALLSNVTGNGNVCLDLATVAGKPITAESSVPSMLTYPDLFEWPKRLRKHPAVGQPGEFRPLILDEKNRLYLYRYWAYEKQLVDTLLHRINKEVGYVDNNTLKDSLERLFPNTDDRDSVWQQVSAVVAAHKKFCVISGGPGTGKTFTVAKVLAVLLEQEKNFNLRILLAAPTGKAAARLGESIKAVKATLNCRTQIIDAIPSEASTIHRMLITLPGSPYFLHNADNPLKADVIVVDEASMIDLALMSKLVSAVPSDARLIIIGDKDQLASVEAGSVLGDICNRDHTNRFSKLFLQQFEGLTGKKPDAVEARPKSKSSLNDCITILKKNYRFDTGSAIGKLSRAINMGNVGQTLSILKNGSTQLEWEKSLLPSRLSRALEKKIISGYSDYLKTEDPVIALKLFNRFRMLCVVKRGPLGVNAINDFTEKVLRRERLITPGGSSGNPWYRGRPVLITRNDYNSELFNGDMGITLPLPATGEKNMYVFFAEKSGRLRRFSPHGLPEHETAYAATIHKSQGSEFDHVLLLLPDHDSPLLTRELLYTGITRATQQVSIWGFENIIKAAVARKIERTSGLRDAFWS